jgi:hypothetical protein
VQIFLLIGKLPQTRIALHIKYTNNLKACHTLHFIGRVFKSGIPVIMPVWALYRHILSGQFLVHESTISIFWLHDFHFLALPVTERGLSFLTVPNLSFENFLGLVLTTKIP